jgi:hypothetical protein
VSSDVPPCWFYRAAGPAQCLAKAGEIEYVRLEEPLRVKLANRQHGPTSAIGIVNPPEVDVVVFVRGVFPERMHEIIRLLQQRYGIAVVVDYDDAYRHLPPELLNRYKINPNLNPFYNWRWAEKAAELADAVTVSTPALQAYYPQARMLRNCIPDRYLHVTHKGDGRTIGWTGTVYGHPNDLPQVGGGVAQAMERTGARFVNVGDGVKIRESLGLAGMPRATMFVPLERYPYEVAQLDVGIAPLHDSLYSNAKSWLKPAEYLSVGAAYVASPTSEYRILQEKLEEWCLVNNVEPPGLIAGSRGREWRRALLRLLQLNPEARAVGREFVRETLRMEDHAYLWGEAWEEAIKHRRGNGRA